MRSDDGGAALQASILDALSKVGVWAWRCNSGQAKRRGYTIALAPAGTPDIVGIMPDGRFLGIEVKGPGDELSRAQVEWLVRADRCGACVGTAHTVREALRIVGKL